VAKSKPAKDLGHIPEPLREFAVPIDSLIPDPDNAKVHPERSIEFIRASLDEFGQDQLIVFHLPSNRVIKGNGRLAAAKLLGWKFVAAVGVHESKLSAAGRAIADNRTAELSRWDRVSLQQIMAKVKDDPKINDRLRAGLAELSDELGLVDQAPAQQGGAAVAEVTGDQVAQTQAPDPGEQTMQLSLLVPTGEYNAIVERISDIMVDQGFVQSSQAFEWLVVRYARKNRVRV